MRVPQIVPPLTGSRVELRLRLPAGGPLTIGSVGTFRAASLCARLLRKVPGDLHARNPGGDVLNLRCLRLARSPHHARSGARTHPEG
jgi:hypothetical protein